jgi:hypothetical protein
MPKEIWKEIPKYPDYEASTLGRIRNKKGLIMSPYTHISGNGKEYKRLKLCYRGKQKLFFVHTLVCLTFHGPKPFSKAVCCHKDDDGFNNKSENLKWGTQSYNVWQSWHKGQEEMPIGDTWEPPQADSKKSDDFEFSK